MTSRMNEAVKSAAMKASAFGAIAVARASYLVYSTDAFDKAGVVTDNLRGRLMELAEKLFPLAIVICAVAMFFTRDQKTFDAEKRILIGCCLAFVLICLCDTANADVVQTIKNLFSAKKS
ncbi:hypothetical protein [Butyrivibrio sp. AC2005]|uniref:hypothetical protein n=1 Tax=Butyrivibrio sp. AC2005 TaxID=1280672 RepID=UPI00042471E2|nr:hypothetical protein [Butyrivibrio sp. AC2005]